MTEITMLANDYNRTWNKIQKYQPVLTTNKMMCSFDPKSTQKSRPNYLNQTALTPNTSMINTQTSILNYQSITHATWNAKPSLNNSKENSFIKLDKEGFNMTQTTIPSQNVSCSLSRRTTLSNNLSAYLF